MAIEAGLSQLLITGLKATYPDLQVFGVTTPVDYISKSNRYGIAYRSIIDTPSYILEGQDALSFWEVQLDCIGFEYKDAIKLAKAVSDLLAGTWTGTLSDGTVVKGIFRLPSKVDGITEARNYIRSLEFQIIYYAS